MDNSKLRDLRDYHNLTQQNIADILHVKQQTYAEWESGKKVIPLKHLVTLAVFYEESIDYILGLTKKKNDIYTYIIDKKEIGKKLVLIRKNNHILQKDLAEFLNTTPSTICAYEKGKTLILTAFLYQICKRYKYSIDFIIGGKKKGLN